jgi:hypothetical protein
MDSGNVDTLTAPSDPVPTNGARDSSISLLQLHRNSPTDQALHIVQPNTSEPSRLSASHPCRQPRASQSHARSEQAGEGSAKPIDQQLKKSQRRAASQTARGLASAPFPDDRPPHADEPSTTRPERLTAHRNPPAHQPTIPPTAPAAQRVAGKSTMNGTDIKKAAINKAKQVAQAANGTGGKKRRKGQDLKPIITTEQQQGSQNASPASTGSFHYKYVSAPSPRPPVP